MLWCWLWHLNEFIVRSSCHLFISFSISLRNFMIKLNSRLTDRQNWCKFMLFLNVCQIRPPNFRSQCTQNVSLPIIICEDKFKLFRISLNCLIESPIIVDIICICLIIDVLIIVRWKRYFIIYSISAVIN